MSWDVEDDDDDGDGDENKGKEGDSELHGDGTKKLNVEEMHKSGEEGSKEEKRGDLLQSKGDECVEESKVDKNKEVVEKMGDGSSKKTINEDDERKDSGVDSGKKVIMESKVDDGKDSFVRSLMAVHQRLTRIPFQGCIIELPIPVVLASNDKT